MAYLIRHATAGPPGPPAPAYTHDQAATAAEWIVNHNLDTWPAVRVMTVGGVEMLAEVLHTSTNQLRIYFDQPTAGRAVCS